MGSIVQVNNILYACITKCNSLLTCVPILNFRSNSSTNDLIKISYVGVNNVDLVAVSSMVIITLYYSLKVAAQYNRY